ncbi:MAG: carboxylesterase family protein [Alphaproteobacteria bacterium]|nr:carboxylesterase family protein [Alphaproteobacteria bacterium]
MRTAPLLLLLLGACTTPAAPGAGKGDDTDTAGAADSDTPDTGTPVDTDTADTAPVGCVPPAPAGLSEVRLPHGTFRGEVLEGGIRRWLGLRFGESTAGDGRFRPPTPPGCQDEVQVATAPAPVCVQWSEDRRTVVGSEDCLFLNVWAPKDATDAPVLLWWHGGGHEQGSTSDRLGGELTYDGAGLAARGVVVVAASYRLGPFGFLAHPLLSAGDDGNGNWGTLDQLASLQWVHDHVAAFGGDPGRVTVAGQSAGGVSACRAAVIERARGQMHRAIVASGGCTARPLATALAQGVEVADQVGCEDAPDGACLRQASVTDLMDTFAPLADGVSTLGGTWSGVIDGKLVLDLPRRMVADGKAVVDTVLVSATEEEAGRAPPPVADAATFELLVKAFLGSAGILPLPALVERITDQYDEATYGSWQDAWVAAASDAKFVCTATSDLEAWAAGGARAWRLHFDDRLDNLPKAPSNRPFHGADLLWSFEHLDELALAASAADRAQADDLADVWAAFATTGDPRPDARDWPQWTPEVDPAWRVASGTSGDAGRIDGVHTDGCAVWTFP